MGHFLDCYRRPQRTVGSTIPRQEVLILMYGKVVEYKPGNQLASSASL